MPQESTQDRSRSLFSPASGRFGAPARARRGDEQTHGADRVSSPERDRTDVTDDCLDVSDDTLCSWPPVPARMTRRRNGLRSSPPSPRWETPQDVTLQETRMECFFPMDAETEGNVAEVAGTSVSAAVTISPLALTGQALGEIASIAWAVSIGECNETIKW